MRRARGVYNTFNAHSHLITASACRGPASASSRGIVCWGKADDWKLVLLAVHERAFQRREEPFAAVLLPTYTRFLMAADRAVVEDACLRLGIGTLAWLDPYDRLNGASAEA